MSSTGSREELNPMSSENRELNDNELQAVSAGEVAVKIVIKEPTTVKGMYEDWAALGGLLSYISSTYRS